MEKVESIKIRKDQSVKDLVAQMKKAGFGARKIGYASEIIGKMFGDNDCRVFLGFAGAMVPAGMKQIFIDLVKEKKIDVLVTTGANLTHDMIEVLGNSHYHCDSWDDEKFQEKGYDRMYNVLMKNDVYVPLENFIEKNWDKFNGCESIAELLKVLGSLLPSDSNSILRACYDTNVDLYCPGLADSGIGLMIWGRLAAGKKITVGAFNDMNKIIDSAWTAKKSGVIYIGGGMPKNFIQQSLQFSKGASYGVQITIDRVEGGGSSGAPLEEGKSWGKLENSAQYVNINCDATIAMPLIFGSIS